MILCCCCQAAGTLLLAGDPVRMRVDEMADARLGQMQRGAHGQGAVRLDDQGDGPAPGSDQLVDRDGHA